MVSLALKDTAFTAGHWEVLCPVLGVSFEMFGGHESPCKLFLFPQIQHLDSWPDFPVVCQHLATVVKQKFPGERIQVVYVCGTDHARHCGNLVIKKNIGVCVVSRESGQGLLASKFEGMVPVQHTGEDAGDVAGHSSTQVRFLQTLRFVCFGSFRISLLKIR